MDERKSKWVGNRIVSEFALSSKHNRFPHFTENNELYIVVKTPLAYASHNYVLSLLPMHYSVN